MSNQSNVNKQLNNQLNAAKPETSTGKTRAAAESKPVNIA